MSDDPNSDDKTSVDTTMNRRSESGDDTDAFDSQQPAPTSSFGQPLRPGERLGRYEILECLDRGGMGVVYRARHTALGKQVALKVVSTMLQSERGAMDRFLREMQAIGCLEPHPHVLNAYDAGTESGVQYIATELIDGMHLGELVSRTGPLAVSEACKIISQAASALEHLRKHNLVHRDVKPNNLMLTRDGVVKIVDMGLALLREEQADRLTLAGEAMGSVDYIAPEQWRDSHEVDWRSDVYSLGCTFYYLLAGRAPYSDKKRNSFSRMQAHLEASFPDIRARRGDVPAEAAKLLLAMVAKDPEDRLTNLLSISEQLDVIASGDLKGLVTRGFTSDPPKREVDFSPAPPTNAPRVIRGSKQPSGPTQETEILASPQAESVTEPNKPVNIALAASILGLLLLGGAAWMFKPPAVELERAEVLSPNANATEDIPVARQSLAAATLQTVANDREVISCIGHSSKVKGLVFLEDQRLCSVSEKGVLCLFDITKPQIPMHTVQICGRAASSIVYQPENQSLLIACEDGSLQIRSSQDGSKIRSESEVGGLTAATLIPSTNLAAVTGWKGLVRLTDLSSKPWTNQVISEMKEAVFDVDVTSDGRKVVWVGRTPEIGVYDLKTEELRQIPGHEDWVFAVAVSPDGVHIASGGQESMVRVTNLETGEADAVFSSVVPQAILFLPDSQYLAVAGRGGSVELWDWQEQNQVASFEANKPIDCIAVSPNGKQIAAGTVDGRVLIWSLAEVSQSDAP